MGFYGTLKMIFYKVSRDRCLCFFFCRRSATAEDEAGCAEPGEEALMALMLC